MEVARAVTKYIRISPRKARLAAGLIRGKPVDFATSQLMVSNLKGGRLMLKTLDSAVANAEVKGDVPRDKLKVLEVRVDCGPTMKRAKPKNKGGRHPILKRSSHFTIVVGE
ncbi:MAG: 50S ribosomal protein L22 [Parachlamydiales bacterium]|nr:50S ribosomal protein L22 [Parachlamydiales bacterium]